ncbi:MAG: SpoIIIAH-like family protein [Clostridia bacterium]|nr:SpoIIIAH-like family protein [Clostridia bacterium]NLS85878.1 SpoIIIAH-like family protein [Oscillospiraceae bacterium]
MKNRRKLTLLTLVVALAAAVYLNWQYAQSETSFTTDGAAVSATVSDPLAEETQNAAVTEQLPDKNYGDAQLVNATQTSGDKYFEQARLTRSQTRDEALDKLQKTLKTAQLSSEEKANLTQTLSQTVDSITTESEIENIIIAKGFTDCVVFIDGEKVSVAVKPGTSALDSASVAQIRDAVLSKTDVSSKNINVVEVK